MAITLNGEIVHSCDTATDFQTLNTGANISGDDDIVEGAGAAGDKISNGTDELVVDAFEGATTTFDFSVGGTHEGWHGIGYVNTKTPINATSGIQAYARNSAGHNGYINAMPSYFYVGGFTTRVWNPSADFTAASTWTTTGNPAQLDDVTGFGFRFTTTTSIMGSFNNVQVDQFTFGLGVRADAGTSGTPNTYQDMVDQDQDTDLWGWLSSFGAKGGIYIGPATGTTASWFVDSAFAVKFLDENVAAGFYGFFIRGANTTCTFTLANISAENPLLSRWELTLDSAMGDTTGGFTDTNSTYTGSSTITLNSNASLTGTTSIDGQAMIQNGATLDGITAIDSDIVTTEHYLSCVGGDLDLLTNSTFESNGVGHALEYAPVGAGPFDEDINGCEFVGYAAQGGTAGDRALYINPATSSADITLNILNGSAPSYRLAAGYTGTFTMVVDPVTTRITCESQDMTFLEDVRVLLETADAGTGGAGLPYQNAVTTLTSAGTTATLTATAAHGLTSGDSVVVRGAADEYFNKQVESITVSSTTVFTYTVDAAAGASAGGTPVFSYAALSGDTNISGVISTTKAWPVSQGLVGWCRKSTTSPYFKQTPVSVADASGGTDLLVLMISDE